MLQIKEQVKIGEKELNETELSNLPNKKLNIMVLKMLTRLEKSLDELSESFNKKAEKCKL